MRLCQIIRDETKAPFGKIYLGVLNATNYIINIIEEWKNSTVSKNFNQKRKNKSFRIRKNKTFGKKFKIHVSCSSFAIDSI